MAEQPKTRRVRIEHDGSMNPMKTRITDAETGELIRHITRVEFTADAGGVVAAVLYLVAPEIDVIVDAEIRTEPPEGTST